MRKLCIGLLLLALIVAAENCNRSTAKPTVENISIEKHEQLNAMDEELIGTGETLDDSRNSFEEEVAIEEEMFFEDSPVLE